MIIVAGTLLICVFVLFKFAESAPEYEELSDGSYKSVK
jgi:hypothetical protein